MPMAMTRGKQGIPIAASFPLRAGANPRRRRCCVGPPSTTRPAVSEGWVYPSRMGNERRCTQQLSIGAMYFFQRRAPAAALAQWKRVARKQCIERSPTEPALVWESRTAWVVSQLAAFVAILLSFFDEGEPGKTQGGGANANAAPTRSVGCSRLPSRLGAGRRGEHLHATHATRRRPAAGWLAGWRRAGTHQVVHA